MKSGFVGLQSTIWKNKLKTFFLIIMFPIVLFLVTFVVFAIAFRNIIINDGFEIFFYNFLNIVGEFSIIIIPIIIVRFFISMYFHRQLIFSFSGAKPITRKENPEIYNIVENLCISKGLPTVKIGILNDDSMNAFATGRGKNAWIVFSKGLIEKLNKREIEAVAGHELTHIINKDTFLMVIIIVFIGIFVTLGQILIRLSNDFSSKSNKDNGKVKTVLILSGIIFLIVGYIFFPIIKLAISRKREFLADAGSVELTKDKESMISALRKISTDSQIESIKKDTVASMCIENPFDKNRKSFLGRDFWSTHPSISKRINMLQSV